MIVNAEGAIVGRLASTTAKKLMLGETVIIVNAEKAVISGKSSAVKERYLCKRQRGDRYKGPFYPKEPSQIIRRTIRGMLPYKKAMGAAAFRRLKVYPGCPEEFKNLQIISKNSDDLKCKFMTLKDVSKSLGAKHE